MPGFDVIVVGGGAVGTSALWNLARRGAKRTLLLERLEGYGRGATGIWGSLVRMFYEKLPITQAAARAVPFYNDFEAHVGIPLTRNRIGSLYFLDRARIEHYQEHLAALAGSGAPFELVEPAQGRKTFPDFAWHERDLAVYEPGAGLGSPRETTEAFLRAAERLGATAHRDAEVVEILREGSRATGVRLKDGRTFACDHLVVSAGVWTNQVLAGTGQRVAAHPVSIQLNRFRWRDHARTHPFFIDLPALTFGHPTANGSFIGGWQGEDTEAVHGGVQHLNPAAASHAKHKLAARIPWLKHATLEGGIKALESYTSSGVGLVEKLAGHDNVVVSTGWSCTGFTLAPVIGERIAELVLGS